MEGVGLKVKNEGWGVKRGRDHKFVLEWNLILLVAEGCMYNFITLGQPIRA